MAPFAIGCIRFALRKPSEVSHEVALFVNGGVRAERVLYKFLKRRAVSVLKEEQEPRRVAELLVAAAAERYPKLVMPLSVDPAGEAAVRKTFRNAKPLEFRYGAPALATSYHRAAVRSVHPWGFRVRLVEGVRSFSWERLHRVEDHRGLGPFVREGFVSIGFPRGESVLELKLYSIEGMLTKAWG